MNKTAGDRHAADRRVVRTDKAICDAFLKLVEEQDYRKITITSLAREADIDRKTFYLHYDSVDDVVDKIIRDEAEHIVNAMRKDVVRGGSVDIAELFVQIGISLVPDVSRTRRIVKHVSVEDVLAKIEGPLTEMLIEENLFDAVELGPYLGYCVSFFIAGLMAMYRRWLLSDSEIPLESISEVARTVVFFGMNGATKERLGERVAAMPR